MRRQADPRHLQLRPRRPGFDSSELVPHRQQVQPRRRRVCRRLPVRPRGRAQQRGRRHRAVAQGCQMVCFQIKKSQFG
jgi:hypothetical protein